MRLQAIFVNYIILYYIILYYIIFSCIPPLSPVQVGAWRPWGDVQRTDESEVQAVSLQAVPMSRAWRLIEFNRFIKYLLNIY